MLVDDVIEGIDRITHCDELTATPINLGSAELLSVNELLDHVEAVAGVKLERRYKLDAPKGVVGRNSDNTMIKKVLGWEPAIPFKVGIKPTYEWIESQYNARKAGARTAA
jgi:nucleoside-diphosphate-sugar epimerase